MPGSQYFPDYNYSKFFALVPKREKAAAPVSVRTTQGCGSISKFRLPGSAVVACLVVFFKDLRGEVPPR